MIIENYPILAIACSGGFFVWAVFSILAVWFWASEDDSTYFVEKHRDDDSRHV